MKVRIGGEVFAWEPRFSVQEMWQVQEFTGCTRQRFFDALSYNAEAAETALLTEGEMAAAEVLQMKALICVAWLCRTRAGERLTLAACDFDVSDFEIEDDTPPDPTQVPAGTAAPSGSDTPPLPTVGP